MRKRREMDKTVRVQQIVVTAKYLRNSSTATCVGFVVFSQSLSATRASKSCAFKEANLLSASIVALYSKDTQCSLDNTVSGSIKLFSTQGMFP